MRCLVICFVIIFASGVFAQTRRPLSPDDVIRIARVGDVLMSPDGETVFYSISRLDWDKNKNLKTFYMSPSTASMPV